MSDFTQIIAEINTNLPDNTSQSITAAKLRTTLIDLTNAIEGQQDSFEDYVEDQIDNIDIKFATNQELEDVSIVNDLSSGGADNVLSAEQGKVLNEKIEDLASYVTGAKETFISSIENGAANGHPARNDGDYTESGYFRRYVVDLTGLYAYGYRKIKFFSYGYTTGGQVTPGLVTTSSILTTTVSVESSVSTSSNYQCGWFELPITSSSKYLIATVLTNVGVTDIGIYYTMPSGLTPSYVPTTVEAIIDDSIDDRIENLETSVAYLEANSLTEANIVNDFNGGGNDDVLSANAGKELYQSVFGTTYTDYDLTFETAWPTHPARYDGAYTPSGYYRRYVVDLTGLYAAGYRKIRFYGFNYQMSSNIVAGLVGTAIDSSNVVTVESYIENTDNYADGWFELPITASSVIFVGTVLTSLGIDDIGDRYENPSFVPTYVVFPSDDTTSIDARLTAVEEAIDNNVEMPMTFLPKKIYGVVGDTMQIFKRGCVISQTPYNYYAQMECKQGKEYQRYLEITPVDPAGTSPQIKLCLIDDYFNKTEYSTSDFVIKNSLTSPSSNINVLCVGASTTASGQWASELKRRLTEADGAPEGNNLTNISFVGRKSIPSSDVCPVSVNVEATGGWTWKTFYTPQDAIRFTVSGISSLNVGDIYKYNNSSSEEVRVMIAEINITAGAGNIRCIYSYDSQHTGLPGTIPGTMTRTFGTGDSTINFSAATLEDYCPFYDQANPGEAADFSTYASTYCNGHIDVAIFNLGNINAGLVGDADMTTIISNMKVVLDGLHSDFPNAKAIIAPGIGYNTYFGMENNYDANSKYRSWAALFAQFKYAKAVEEFISGDGYKDWCFLADTIAEVDAENAFPVNVKATNQRYAYLMTPATWYSQMTDTSKIYLLTVASGGYEPGAYEYKNGEWVIKEGYAETIGTNGAHPTLLGYQMTADAIYRCFANVVL